MEVIARSPLGLGNAGTTVHGPRHHEQQIGQPIEVDDDARLDGIGAQPDHAALGTATDSPGEVQERARRRPTGQNEPSQRRQLRFEAIDRLLEQLDLLTA